MTTDFFECETTTAEKSSLQTETYDVGKTFRICNQIEKMKMNKLNNTASADNKINNMINEKYLFDGWLDGVDYIRPWTDLKVCTSTISKKYMLLDFFWNFAILAIIAKFKFSSSSILSK